MGDFGVREIKSKEERYRMYHYALKDIEAFEKMWQTDSFVQEPIKIGAEQELCIVKNNFTPAKSALDLLDEIKDEHYTNELGLYNLEINLDPENLENNCFEVIEKKLRALIDKGVNHAKNHNEHILMTGILPTIYAKHLSFDYMTPIPRYKTLSQMLYNLRGGAFEIYLQGVDDLIASLGSVLFEACNTSFQLHLQIKPTEFVDRYNWAQMISGPVLSACVNSPILLGRELWAESRIALFKQSLDTRNSKNHLRSKIPRVYFGNDWLRDSPVNLWKNELIRFPLIITSDNLSDSLEQLEAGEVPELRAIRLHNGTTYTWNRLCYGPGKKPHLRIECRYLPAGPTAVDEIANFAFWVGLMNAMPDNWSATTKNISFKVVKDNFIKSARNGLNSVFNWYGENVPAKELMLNTLLPMAKKGLAAKNVAEADIDKYLGIIEQRVQSEQTGAAWMTNYFRKCSAKCGPNISRQKLVEQMILYQKDNIPVHQWDVKIDSQKGMVEAEVIKPLKVGHLMSTKIFVAKEETSLDLVKNIFKWKNIHHLPVENNEGQLVGIITDGMMQNAGVNAPTAKYATEIMLKDFISVKRETTISELRDLLSTNNISGLPVSLKGKLIGMITANDLNKLESIPSKEPS